MPTQSFQNVPQMLHLKNLPVSQKAKFDHEKKPPQKTQNPTSHNTTPYFILTIRDFDLFRAHFKTP